jgi:arsenical pump membrane protein
MFRPKPLNEAVAAALGAALLLIVGVVPLSDLGEVWRANSNVLFFFFGLMVISTIADQSGFFEWCALIAVKVAKGNGSVLFSTVFALGALLTAFFSNDATALILTPIVFSLVSRLKLNPIPYVFACAFVANTASMLLPVSNPVNLLAVGRFDLTLGDYLRHLLLPSLLLLFANWLIFGLIFRRSISSYRPNGEALPSITLDRFFSWVCVGLVLTALGYIWVSIYGLPLSYPALGGASFLLLVSVFTGRFRWRKVVSGLSWQIFVFIFALALLVKGLDNSGATDAIARGLAQLESHGDFLALISVTVSTALGSNLMNNWPMMLVSVSSLGSTAAPDAHSVLVYGAVIGADIGPNIAVLGSLSSMLWLVCLRQRGLEIHPLDYLKLGLRVAPVLIGVGILALALSSRIFG